MQPAQPKRGPGQPRKPEVKVRAVRLDEARWEKLKALGGREWLERQLDKELDPQPK